MIEYLSFEEYLQTVNSYEGGHWTTETIDKRWHYHASAIALLKTLDLTSAEQVLEMGTMGVQLIKGSHTLDYEESWDFPGKKPTHLHDAREIPWPIANKSYDVFVALRVFQHLTPMQSDCLKEAMRISRKVILVIPGRYANRELPHSRGITYGELLRYNSGVHPNLFLQTMMGNLYY